MKKLAIFSLVIVFLCISCATSIRDLERKKEAGKSIEDVYDYNWEEVYSGMSYVWRHSESTHIQTRYKMGSTDFAKDEKAAKRCNKNKDKCASHRNVSV